MTMKMKKILSVCALSAFMCVNAMAEQINVLAAASLRYVLEDIKSEFLKTHKKEKLKISPKIGRRPGISQAASQRRFIHF